MEELKDRFRAWLDSDSYKPFVIEKNNSANIYVKIPRGDDFDYIFEDYLDSDLAIERESKLRCCGIYHKSDHMIYDAHGWFRSIDPALEPDHGISDMSADITKTVRELTENRLRDDIHYLDVQTLSSPKYKSDLEYAERYAAPEKARKLFLLRQEPEDIHFECEYEFLRWSDSKLLDYITDREAFCQSEAKAYWQNHQEDMCLQFLINDLVRDELTVLNELEDSPLHRIRGIIDAVADTSAKSVNVTVVKDGKELTFKSEAGQFCSDPGTHYSTWYIPSKDRAEFYLQFGRGADFAPEDITRITYNGKSIYEAAPFEPEEDEGFELSM